MHTPSVLPSAKDIKTGVRLFEQHLPREAMYKTATFLVAHHWGSPREMADGLGVLLLTWNQAFYRYGQFSFDSLENCIKRNRSKLRKFRDRNILSYSVKDDLVIKKLFEEVQNSLSIHSGAKAGVSSPVAVAKALHLLAPSFFPLWDDKIARGYRLHYSKNPEEKYVHFIRLTSEIVRRLPKKLSGGRNGRSAVKLVDEYNFAKYTRKWL